MKNTFTPLLFASLAVLFFSCDMEFEPVQRFDFYLQGTWVTNNPNDIKYEPGTIVIDFDTITISGFGINSNYPNAVRPFNGFAKDVPLKGYSEINALFIYNAGTWQRISYYLEDQGIGKNNLLFLTFGTDAAILQKKTSRYNE